MYEFLRGPLVWIALLGFVGGLCFRLVTMAALARREKSVLPTYDFHYGARSIRHWMIPFAARNMRKHPVFTLVSFAFHACLLLTPLFVMGHAVLWQESWGVQWWSLPAPMADLMSGVVVLGGLFFILRRAVAPEVRNVTTWKDIALALLVIAPFFTGLASRRGWLPADTMLTLHMITGALWLLAIPFTRLVHMLWFPFSRAFMGSEFGKVRNARDW